MKYRNDFVTNSSSSSFVVSQNNDINDVDKLFIFIKCSYAKWLLAQKDMIQFCIEHKEFNVEKTNGKVHISPIHSYKDEKGRQRNWKLSQMIEDKFGVSIHETFDRNIDWMSANTYAEYLELTKNQKYVDANFKPFEIIDINNPEEDAEIINEIIDWYYPCYGEYDPDSSCKYCDFEATTNCVENIEREEFIKLNGRLCVWSECGYIPDFVRKELENICILHCNHMG